MGDGSGTSDAVVPITYADKHRCIEFVLIGFKIRKLFIFLHSTSQYLALNARSRFLCLFLSDSLSLWRSPFSSQLQSCSPLQTSTSQLLSVDLRARTLQPHSVAQYKQKCKWTGLAVQILIDPQPCFHLFDFNIRNFALFQLCFWNRLHFGDIFVISALPPQQPIHLRLQISFQLPSYITIWESLHCAPEVNWVIRHAGSLTLY